MKTNHVVELEDDSIVYNVYDNPYFVEYTQYYSLSGTLSNYGPPERAVLLLAPRELPWEEGRLFLFLDYTDLGWVAFFTMDLRQDTDNYIGCPDQAFKALLLWSPGDIVAEERGAMWAEGDYNFSIEEATSLGMDEFYEQFQDPTQCLQTPKDIWPQSAAE
jgi:hypothetical protein